MRLAALAALAIMTAAAASAEVYTGEAAKARWALMETPAIEPDLYVKSMRCIGQFEAAIDAAKDLKPLLRDPTAYDAAIENSATVLASTDFVRLSAANPVYGVDLAAGETARREGWAVFDAKRPDGAAVFEIVRSDASKISDDCLKSLQLAIGLLSIADETAAKLGIAPNTVTLDALPKRPAFPPLQ